MTGSFRRINDTNLFMYEHSAHVTCSSIALSDLPFLYVTNKDDGKEVRCKELAHNHHVILP